MYMMHKRRLSGVLDLELAIGCSGDVLASPDKALACLLFSVFSFFLAK